jgi:hypothetical protein
MPFDFIHRNYLKTHNLILILLLFFVVINGCGSSPGPMAGTWLFSLTSGVSLNQVLATANLKQSGSEITGTVTFSGSISCNADTSVLGTLKGNALHVQFVQSQSIADLTGTVNLAFTSGSGTYIIEGSSCLQDFGSGTWSAAFLSS